MMGNSKLKITFLLLWLGAVGERRVQVMKRLNNIVPYYMPANSIQYTKRQLSGGQSTLFVYFQTLLNTSHVPGSTMLLRQPYKSIHSSVYFPLQLSGCALWTYNVISAVPGRRYLIFYTTSQRPFSIPDSINQYQVPGHRYAGIGTNVSVPSANSPTGKPGTWYRYLVSR